MRSSFSAPKLVLLRAAANGLPGIKGARGVVSRPVEDPPNSCARRRDSLVRVRPFRSPTLRAEARGGVVGLFGAAAGERGDEAALGRGEWAAGEVGDGEVPQQRCSSGEAEAFEVAALDF